MLGLAVQMLDTYPAAAQTVRERFHAFTVDEYQDVNTLQAALLDRWLGDREELCVVGDDYQTIYSFTGASPDHLLGFTERFPSATVVRLERNYRSTPEILGFANELASHLGGFRKTLEATVESGPPVIARPIHDVEEEVASVVQAVGKLQADGVALEQMAVLYRINARSEAFEEAFAAEHIPYQVRDGSFLRRPGPKAVLQRLKRPPAGSVGEVVNAVTDGLGFDPDNEPDADEEVTRQADLARLRAMAEEFDRAHDHGDVAAFVEELGQRFSTERSGRGVNLLTYHRAKGLEFDAVFLPRLLDGELPFRSGRAKAEPDEERRLLYVGITRARTICSSRGRPTRRPSRARSWTSSACGRRRLRAGRRTARIRLPKAGGPVLARLKEWRKSRARADGVPAYVIFHDATLEEIAELLPKDWADLASISGVGPTKLERYGDEVLAVVATV